MRYLYGDSKSFPGDHNFLRTLEVFMATASQAVLLEASARSTFATAMKAAGARNIANEELEKFHRAVLTTLQKTTAGAVQPHLQDYARQVVEFATSIVDETRLASTRVTDREQADARAEGQRLRSDVRSAIESMLVSVRLPVTSTLVTMRLDDATRANQMSAVFSHPEGIMTTLVLNASHSAEWRKPRKVSEFVHNLDLMVGVKKSWIGRAVKPDLLHLDDFIIGGFDLGEDAAEIRLRRKPEAPDALLFNIRRDGEQLIADAHHPGDAEAEAQLSSHVEGGDKEHLERLWTMLRAGASDALQAKSRLVSVTLDGNDVFESEKVIPFIERLVKMLAPTVQEIARRSPNTRELSLKSESDDGRREEIYVKKEDLVAKLDALGEKEKAIFAPFKLARDEWISVSDFVLDE